MSCKSCFETEVQCCDDIIVKAGLSANTSYYWILNKVGSANIYQKLVTTDGQGNLTIEKTALPKGFLADGFFKLQVRLGNNHLTPKVLTFNEKEYDCVVFQVGNVVTNYIQSEPVPDTAHNWDDVEYNQETGEFTFIGETEDGTLINMFLFDIENPSLPYNNVTVGPFEGDTTTVQGLPLGQVGVRWNKITATPPYQALTSAQEKIITITRISQTTSRLWVYGEDNIEVKEINFPIIPVNINDEELDQVTNIDEYIIAMNEDEANASKFTILSYTKFPFSGTAQYYLILMAPTEPYQEELPILYAKLIP